MRLRKVTDRVYANWDGETGGNVGIIELSETSIAIDAQYPGSARKFREAIPKATSKPLSHLLLTHVHGDHVFGNMVFRDLEIVSHRRLWEKMEASLKNEIIEDVEFIHTGGHSDCSSIVYLPDEKVLYAGDLLFVGRFPWAGDPTADPDKWIEAFQTILKMDVEKIIPGHGPLCDLDEVESQLGWMKEIRWIMQGLIEDGASEEEVVSYAYRELYPTDRPEWQMRSYARWYKVWSG
jgi:glyoxylase-like metal-dependent hydrolase (beta-lactamase superfamily II)